MNPLSLASARRFCAALLALLSLALPATARAELIVTTLEHGPWPASVAALQHDLQSQGAVVHVVVTDETGRRATCAEYTLSLDPVGAAAFAMGACDARTEATALVLRQRSALFEHGDVIAHPRPVAITAVQTRTGSVSGGALSAGGSEVTCSVAVRPFLRDMESGAVVHLTPGRFVLRPLGAGITAAIDADGWSLTGASAGLTIDYEVVDTQRREVVLRDRATLHCATTDLTVAAGVPVDPSCGSTLALPPGATVAGSTRFAANRFGAGCGAGAQGPDVVYALTLQAPARVRIRLTSDFDGVLTLRGGCQPGGPEIACNDDAPDTRHSFIERTLLAGTYYVVVDGYGASAQGSYQLRADLFAPGSVGGDEAELLATPDTVGITCANALPLPHDATVHGTTRNASDQMRATCGSAAASPERVYALVLERRARVRLSLASDYDGVLYVRTRCDEGAEVGCNDDERDTRHSALDLMLDAGTYFVFVDGYASGHTGDYDLTARVDPERVGVELRAGVTYASSGTPLGAGVGFAASAHVRIPVGRMNALLGVRYGVEQFAAETPGALDVMTWGVPLTVDLPLGDGSVHLYSVLEPGVVRARSRNPETDATGFAMSLGEGVGLYPWRSLGMYVEVDYRIAELSSARGDALLSHGASFACGASARF